MDLATMKSLLFLVRIINEMMVWELINTTIVSSNLNDCYGSF
jgi:hypothetical protein